MRVVLRGKRQITLPSEICDALGLKPGDSLNVEVENGMLRIEPGRKASLDTLKEIWRIMAESGVTEEELQEGGRQIRKELFERDHPELAKRPVG
jgi:AbrB family looped-hinge helix DNA binding protein